MIQTSCMEEENKNKGKCYFCGLVVENIEEHEKECEQAKSYI